MIGTRLAHYEITAHLGSGGMGDVYRATDARLQRSVAIKILSPTLASDPDRLARLRREARLKRGAMPVAEALAVAKQICEALEAAHQRGVIHRDLKPGNVMLTAEGQVKVLDFGDLLSRWTSRSGR